MDEITLISGKKMRVEGARVVLPGFEWAEVAATPFIDYDYEPTDLWEITDIATGMAVGQIGGHATIEDAIAVVCAYLRSRGVTKEMYAAAQARATARSQDTTLRPAQEPSNPKVVQGEQHGG